jgi:hypothetical protein
VEGVCHIQVYEYSIFGNPHNLIQNVGDWRMCGSNVLINNSIISADADIRRSLLRCYNKAASVRRNRVDIEVSFKAIEFQLCVSIERRVDWTGFWFQRERESRQSLNMQRLNMLNTTPVIRNKDGFYLDNSRVLMFVLGSSSALT